MTLRAAIVVTGTEVLTGRVTDRNGPWLADRLLELGIDIAQITIVGDRREDMARALRAAADDGVALILTSGGLGPTEDDLTAEIVGAFQGRPMVLDEGLHERIGVILEGLTARWPDLDQEAVRAGNAKQATIPSGATILEPVGTAPGLVVPPADGGEGPTVVVLPGPPGELQPMWPAAVATDAFAHAIAGGGALRQEMLRLFGIPESEIAETLRRARHGGVDIDALEITTCMRRGEIEVVTRFDPAQQALYDAFADVVRERHPETLYSTDGTSVDEQVAALLRDGRLTIAACESCTGGLLLGRLTALPGSSDYVAGGVVVYSNDLKIRLAGVDPAVLEAKGAVSQEVADALADGARSRCDADVGVGITGVAGPGGGTPDKPVGLVWVAVAGPDGTRLTRKLDFPGSREAIRDRTTTVALHLVRRLLTGEGSAGLP